MSLPDVRGHAEAREHLARSLRAGKLPQSVLLYGAPGIGKERLGLWLAQLLVCESPDAETGPCGSCQPCRLTNRLEHPDVHWFFPLPRPDAASPEKLRDKLEEARAAELQAWRDNPGHQPSFDRAPAHFLGSILTLQQLAALRPSMGRRKVFVIGDAERMVPQESSPEAANAFLKLLEEPAADTTLILTSSQPGALLPTIRSRVLPIRLFPLREREVSDYLTGVAQLPAERAATVAARARGAIGRALQLAQDGDAAGPLAKQLEAGRQMLLAALSRGGAVPRLAAAHAQPPAGARGDFLGELDALSDWLRDLMALASQAADAVADPAARQLLQRALEQQPVSPPQVAAALLRVARARELAQGNVNPQLLVADLLRGIQAELRPAGPDQSSASPHR